MIFKIATASILVIINICVVYAQDKPMLNDNFYENINYDWFKNTKIPPSESYVTPFTLMRHAIAKEMIGTINSLEKAKTPAEQKVKDLYFSYMDKKTRNKLGIEPIKKYLLDIKRVKNHKELALLIAKFAKDGIDTLFKFSVIANPKNADQYILQLYQSGIFLNRERYLSKKKRSKNQRGLYTQLLTKFFTLADYYNIDKRIENIINIETKLAKVQFTRVQNRDLSKIFNFYSYKEVLNLLNNFPLEGMFNSLSISRVDSILVYQPSYLKSINKLFKNISVSQWKDYLRAKVFIRFSNTLSEEFEKAKINFDKQLGLIKKEEVDWKKGIDFVFSHIPMIMGKVYVDRFYDKKTKVYINKLAQAIKDEYKMAIVNTNLFSKETKAKALKKLKALVYNIGAPDKWHDFSKLEIKKNDLVGNSIRVSRFYYYYNISKLNKLVVDRAEWSESPYKVNAYYSLLKNKFVLLAAILRKPFFDINATDAQNFGGIGFIIGHEIGHAFDDQGSQFDDKGNFVNWWSSRDKKAFNKLKNKLIAQANKYQPLPNIYLNGALKIGEIIGDLSGSQIAYSAYVRFAKKAWSRHQRKL